MKPFSIVLSIILGISSLGLIVWIGRFGMAIPQKPANDVKRAPTVEDLPLPESGPYGVADVSEAEYDFGSKFVGDEDQHHFTLKNSGQGRLAFKLGKSTCQCTVGEITKNGEKLKNKDNDVTSPHSPGEEGSLEPGESIDILVKWIMKTQNEKFRQAVPVFTTDPENRKVEFAIVGRVDAPYHLQPDGVWELGDMSSQQPSRAEGVLATTVINQFTLTEVPRENGRVKVTWDALEPANFPSEQIKCAYKIKIEVGPDVPIGSFHEAITLNAVSGQRDSTINFTVSGRRFGPIEFRGADGANLNINSNRLVFKEFPAAKGATATLTLFVKGMEGDLKLEVAPQTDPQYTAKFLDSGKVLGKSKMYKVEIKILPGHSARHREADAGILDFKTNHPEAPDMRLLLDYNAIH